MPDPAKPPFHPSQISRPPHWLVSLLRRLFILVLMLAAVAGAGFAYWKWQGKSLDNLIPFSPVSTVTPSPTEPTETPGAHLEPTVTISQDFARDLAELEKQLVKPLRQYYATREETLVAITVEPSDDEAHDTTVTVTLQQDEETEIHRFFYDRSGKKRTGEFPTWDPSFFDRTE